MTIDVGIRQTDAKAIGSGALGIIVVGGSVPVVGLLDAYPPLSGQAIRYAVAGLLLLAWSSLRGRRLPRPGRADLVALMGLAVIGMLGFNWLLLIGQRYAEPGFLAAMLGGTPLVLALVAPLLAGRRPSPPAIAGASVVVAGIVVLSGGGSWHGPGLLLAVLVLAGEAAFTLLAVGVIDRLGGFAASTWCCLVAGGLGAVVATFLDGVDAWRAPSWEEAGAIAWLAVLTTAIAFCLWYFAVSRLGADRAGVLVGLMPVSGLAMSVILGAQALTPVSVGGVALVTAGCVLGLSRGRRAPSETRPEPRQAVRG